MVDKGSGLYHNPRRLTGVVNNRTVLDWCTTRLKSHTPRTCNYNVPTPTSSNLDQCTSRYSLPMSQHHPGMVGGFPTAGSSGSILRWWFPDALAATTDGWRAPGLYHVSRCPEKSYTGDVGRVPDAQLCFMFSCTLQCRGTFELPWTRATFLGNPHLFLREARRTEDVRGSSEQLHNICASIEILGLRMRTGVLEGHTRCGTLGTLVKKNSHGTCGAFRKEKTAIPNASLRLPNVEVIPVLGRRLSGSKRTNADFPDTYNSHLSHHITRRDASRWS